ncbi:MAG: sigma-70 family RNA polymerase sigma factor [Planctomycetes bacterium]|nr:sigma-70 family RNA polymerase sigma factor [Planctomycetota bacterium]
MSERPVEDIELVERCKRGDLHAYDELMRRHQDRVFNLVYRYVGDREDARDIAQEVFIRAFRAMRGFQGQAAVSTWLHRIAVNEVINHRRRAGAKRRIRTVPIDRNDPDPEGRGSGDPPDTSAEPSKIMAEKEREQLIQDAINSLDDDHRAVVVLKDIEGYRYEEIAEIIGCPRGTVKSRLHRARLELREKLRPLLEVAEPRTAEAGETG